MQQQQKQEGKAHWTETDTGQEGEEEEAQTGLLEPNDWMREDREDECRECRTTRMVESIDACICIDARMVVDEKIMM